MTPEKPLFLACNEVTFQASDLHQAISSKDLIVKIGSHQADHSARMPDA